MRTPRPYLVVSPLMSVVIPILDFGEGPTEEFRCVAEIEAASKRKAIAQSIKHPDMKQWVDECRSDGVSPFIGLKAEVLQ